MIDRLPISVLMPTLPSRMRRLQPDEPGPYRVEGVDYDEGGGLFHQAVRSIYQQTRRPAQICVAVDDGTHTDYNAMRGAAASRQRALDMATEDWVSCLDDDDLAYPWHLEKHWSMLQESGADVAYSWFDGNDPFPMHRGRVFDPAEPHHITTTITMRTEMAKQVGYLQPDGPMHQDWSGEDWKMILGLCKLGAKFIGTGDVTWHYRVHQGNTSGLTTKGDALR